MKCQLLFSGKNGDNLHKISNSVFWEKLVKSFFFLKTGFDISCKYLPMETICMKCQILFSGKNKKISSVCRMLKLPREG